MNGYQHTQTSPLHWCLSLVALIELAGAYYCRHVPIASLTLIAAALITAVLSQMFQQLTVADQGDRLSIRYGPLPGFSKHIPYQQIAQVRVGRSSIIDGWGIHWAPGRGWTYNLWGRDCVELELTPRKQIRIGSDQPKLLAAFLRQRCSLQDSTP